MKRNLLTFAAVGAIALASYTFAESQGGFGGGHGGWHGQGLAMGHLTKALNLTAEQQSKVQPLIDQKFDALQKARQDMRNAMQEMHAAMTQ